MTAPTSREEYERRFREIATLPQHRDWGVLVRGTAAAVTAAITAMDALWLWLDVWPVSDRLPGLDPEARARAPLFPDVPVDARATAWPTAAPVPRRRWRGTAILWLRATSRAPTPRASWRGARRRRRRCLDGRGASA